MKRMMAGSAVVAFALSGQVARAADFFCGAGNVSCLKAAINASNANNQDNLIMLDAGTFTLSTVDNPTDGATGLPVVKGRITIQGPEGTGTTIERDPNVTAPFRIFAVAVGGNLNLEWIGLRNGLVNEATRPIGGAAIVNRGTLRVSRCAIYNNKFDFFHEADGGSAIDSFGPVTITHSELYYNRGIADDGSGATVISRTSLVISDSAIAANYADYVSGLLIAGSASIVRSRIEGNSSWFGTTIDTSGDLFVEDSVIRENGGGSGLAGIMNRGTASIISSTLSTNHGCFGAIQNLGQLNLLNDTIAFNSSVNYACPTGAAGIQNSGLVRARNTIIAFNTLMNSAAASPTPSDCNQFTSLGNNIIGNMSGCSAQLQKTDIIGDPGLTPFVTDDLIPGSGHFGLAAQSRAVDAGDAGGCDRFDQVGNPRYDACDIGAIEYVKARAIILSN